MAARVRLRTDLRVPQYEINVVWKGERAPRRLVGTNKRHAEIKAKEVLRRMQQGLPLSDHTGASTISTYGNEWTKQLGHKSAEDDRRLFRLHVEPRLGTKRLDEIDEIDVRGFIDDMAREPLASTGKPPKARTVRNAHSVLSRLLGSAVAERLILMNPATAERIGKKALPRKGRNRQSPGPFEHLAALLESDAVPIDRRVFYALQYLTGMRLGEVAARRWEDLDESAPRLWLLAVHDQYDGKSLKTEDDEDEDDVRARDVPVHPALRSILTWWRAEGWEMVFGRTPQPADHIVPDRRGFAHLKQRGVQSLPSASTLAGSKNQLIKSRYRDLDAVELRAEARAQRWQGTHTGRRWFISYARSHGAQKDMLQRVTHNATGEMIDRYTWMDWEPLCAAVSSLRFAVPTWAEPAATSATDSATCFASDVDIVSENGGGAGSRTTWPNAGIQRLRQVGAELPASALAHFVENPRDLMRAATHVAEAHGMSRSREVVAALRLLEVALGRVAEAARMKARWANGSA